MDANELAAEPSSHNDRLAAAFEEHRSQLSRFAFILCGDRDTAEDAVAAASERVIRQPGPVDNPLAYLRRSIVNEVQSNKRRELAGRLRDQRYAATLPQTDESFDDTRAQRDLMLAALARLAPRQRAVLALRYLEDLTESETAEVLGIGVGTVKSQSSKALRRLRPILTDMEDHE